MEAAGNAAGFSHLHVSGLPAECTDADVEAALRRALLRERPGCGAGAAEASVDVDTRAHDHADAPAHADANASADVDTKSTDECQKTNETSRNESEEIQAPDNAKEAAEPVEAAAEEARQAAEPVETTAEEARQAVEPLEATEEETRELPGETENANSTLPAASQPIGELEPRGKVDVAAEVDPFVTCTVVRNKDTNVCKGYCFLGFSSMDAAEEAMKILNAGATVAGSQVLAQISQPKERHAKKKDPTEELGDMRLRRQRYMEGSKKKQRGHQTCSDKSAKIATKTGAINAAAGTRTGRLPTFDSEKSTLSGFACAK